MWERLLLRSKRCSEKPRRQREGQKYPSFGFHPHKFLPGVFTPPSLLLFSQGAFQVWEVGFFCGASQDLLNSFLILRGFSLFFSRLASLPDFCSFPKLQWQLRGVGGDGWIWESWGGASGAVGSVYSTRKSWECGSGALDWGHARLLIPVIYWTGSRGSSWSLRDLSCSRGGKGQGKGGERRKSPWQCFGGEWSWE